MVDFKICKGNPGALTFLSQAYAEDMFRAESAFTKAQNYGITGSLLYMLWSDCCGRDTSKAITVLETKDKAFIVGKINEAGGRGIEITDEELGAGKKLTKPAGQQPVKPQLGD